jgi:CDP-diacylglycerol--serine O-phosphatidyltransferase
VSNPSKPSTNAQPRRFPLSRLIPNIVTLSALCVGLSAIRFALAEKWEFAVLAIIAAAILDGMDGGIARALKATSDFGAQLDSLADFVNFSVVPMLVIYLWTLSEINRLGWAVVLFFILCCAIRLARFNVSLLDEERPPWAHRFFSGIPAPMGACLSLLPLLLNFEFSYPWLHNPYINGTYVLLIGTLMASRIPTFSLKKIIIHPDIAVPLMLCVIILLVMFSIEPWLTFTFISLCYLATLPFSIFLYWRLKKSTQTLHP